MNILSLRKVRPNRLMGVVINEEISKHMIKKQQPFLDDPSRVTS